MTARKPAKKPKAQPPYHVAQLANVLHAPELAAALQAPVGEQVRCAHLCRHLLDHPELIARPEWTKVIVRILQGYGADHPPRTPNSAETAFLVDWLMVTGVSLAQARRQVVEFTGKTPAAVKQDHVRSKRKT